MGRSSVTAVRGRRRPRGERRPTAWTADASLGWDNAKSLEVGLAPEEEDKSFDEEVRKLAVPLGVEGDALSCLVAGMVKLVEASGARAPRRKQRQL